MNLLFFILILIVRCTAHTDVVFQEKWQEFQNLFEKNYSSSIESQRRFSIFKENLNKISQHNSLYISGNVTYKLGLNQFTDLTAEEFKGYVNKFQLGNRNNGTKIHEVPKRNVNFPKAIDWRLSGAVTEVRNQGHCGSCWAFSAVGALEGQANIALGKRVRLSEQNLLDCANAKYGNFGCNGGDANRAYVYVQSSGIQAEDSYPYVASQGRCRQKSTELFVVDYVFVPATEEALKETVATVGPISVAIESTSELQHYSEGIFYDWTCTDRLNHGVLAVGYGEENGQEYWLVKNSWGPSWGEQGYFRLARNRFNNCGIASYASFPLVAEKKG